MRDNLGLYYYPDPEDKTTRVYVSEQDGELEQHDPEQFAGEVAVVHRGWINRWERGISKQDSGQLGKDAASAVKTRSWRFAVGPVAASCGLWQLMVGMSGSQLAVSASRRTKS